MHVTLYASSTIPQTNTATTYTLINELEDGMECTLHKFMDDTKLEGVADTLEGRIQSDFNKLEDWTKDI